MTGILSWLIGGGVASLTGPLERAYAAKLSAQNDADRLEAEKQIAFYQGQIELAQSSIDDKWWSPRIFMGWSAAAYVLKIVVWDTVLQLGFTPNPGNQVTGIVMLVIGFYFGSKAATDVASRIFAAIGRRR